MSLQVHNNSLNESGRSCGILIVGLGGANGTTLVAGILANRKNIQWFGPRGEGPQYPNYNGCITQISSRGVHRGVGFRNRNPTLDRNLADANLAVIGGWDIRPKKLGDALFAAQILDYDLVRQVRDEMNQIPICKGYYDSRFIGTSQHAGATHVLEEQPLAESTLNALRLDIQNFKARNHLSGHITVIWSASVEPNCPFCAEFGGLDTAEELFHAIRMTEEERGGPLPPSLIYATAAVLEGCSFVNGGSQNTLCRGLIELAQQKNVYCLGTDFKAGQTKFKTAVVEYLRTMGLRPKVIASSNHLGNNDMYNLATGDNARMAKLRVKNDIFATWDEDIDHHVSVMYTPFINDEKRDYVEYTSLAFLNQVHTMVTYTRASDSVLCVPLMIDAAVWCDFFHAFSWPYDRVAKALAYLFKIPEGAARGVDPGFFRQMNELECEVMKSIGSENSESTDTMKIKTSNPINGGLEWRIPQSCVIICAGLACVDMQLLNATGGDGGENIESFSGLKTMGGGSVSMACKTLSRLMHGTPKDTGTGLRSPAIHSIIPLCKVGSDDAGNTLLALLDSVCVSSRNIETKYVRKGMQRHPDGRTALAVLPIYNDGRRGCFFDAASNTTFSADEIIEMLDDIATDYPSSSGVMPVSFLFGYPHLLPSLQGKKLGMVLQKARLLMKSKGIIVLDLNGVPPACISKTSSMSLRTFHDLKSDVVLGPVFEHVDILHLNEDELISLTGATFPGSFTCEVEEIKTLSDAVSTFLLCGTAIVVVTLGKRGCFVRCGSEERFEHCQMLPSSWAGCSVRVPSVKLAEGSELNTNGAGDAFIAGFLVASLLRRSAMTLSVLEATRFASLVAANHINTKTRDLSHIDVSDLLESALYQC